MSHFYRCFTAPTNDLLANLAKLYGDNPREPFSFNQPFAFELLQHIISHQQFNSRAEGSSELPWSFPFPLSILARHSPTYLPNEAWHWWLKTAIVAPGIWCQQLKPLHNENLYSYDAINHYTHVYFPHIVFSKIQTPIYKVESSNYFYILPELKA